MAAHARLKNELTEDEKYHNLMRWLIYAPICNHYIINSNFMLGYTIAIYQNRYVLGFYGQVNNEVMSSRSVNSGTVPGQA